MTYYQELVNLKEEGTLKSFEEMSRKELFRLCKDTSDGMVSELFGVDKNIVQNYRRRNGFSQFEMSLYQGDYVRFAIAKGLSD